MHIQIPTNFLMVAWALWIVLAMTYAVWPRGAALRALMVVRRLLMAHTFLIFAAVAFITLPWKAIVESVRGNKPQAVAAAPSDFGSCAAVEFGMTKAQVLARAGKPDSVDSAEDIRGTGAVCWRYGTRCAVYLVDNVVQYVE